MHILKIINLNIHNIYIHDFPIMDSALYLLPENLFT